MFFSEVSSLSSLPFTLKYYEFQGYEGLKPLSYYAPTTFTCKLHLVALATGPLMCYVTPQIKLGR